MDQQKPDEWKVNAIIWRTVNNSVLKVDYDFFEEAMQYAKVGFPGLTVEEILAKMRVFKQWNRFEEKLRRNGHGYVAWVEVD